MTTSISNILDRLTDITCPLCGETDFDGPGFVGHIDRWCELVEPCREALAESHRRLHETMARNHEAAKAKEGGQ